MLLLKDNKYTHFYFDKFKMMLERTWGDFGAGDSLWRTSLALIAYGDSRLVTTVHLCGKLLNKKWRYIRHPGIKNDDCSRDQSIMAQVALKLHAYPLYKIRIKKLDFRISYKFTWGDAWFWATERYLIWRIINFYKFLFVRLEPEYSHHLFCWMIWSSKQKMPLFRKLMLRVVNKENYLLRLLLGVTEEIPELKPMSDFRWQRDVSDFDGRELTFQESQFNTLDIDVLKAIIKYNNESTN